MADIKTKVSGLFDRLWRDFGGTTGYGPCVSLGDAIHGENETKDRMDVDFKPNDADSIQELLQDAATGVGTGTAINLKGYSKVLFRVNATSGTWNGGFQITMDDTNWYYVQMVPLDTASAVNGGATQFNPSSATVDNLYTLPQLPVAPSQIRFNIAARTSGTIIVSSRKQPR